MTFPPQQPSSESERADQVANPGYPAPPGGPTGFVPPGRAAVDPSQHSGTAAPGTTPPQDTAQVPALGPLPDVPGEPAPVPQFGDGSPAPRRNRAVMVLAITTVLLFILSATMTGLYMSKSSDLHAANRDIKDLKIALNDSREALRDNKGKLKDSEAANRALSRCVDEVNKMINKIDRDGRADADKAFDACERARPYIADD